MRIRNLLIAAFLAAALVPSAIFGWWSYRRGIEREFAEVSDRHLLLARNLRTSLERYHRNLTEAIETVSISLMDGRTPRELDAVTNNLGLAAIMLVDETSDATVSRVNLDPAYRDADPTEEMLIAAALQAREGRTQYTPVLQDGVGNNVILGVRRYGRNVSIAVVNTRYFVELGRSISFGDKGHAVIVDHKGNALFHPSREWTNDRKDLSQLSAVKRLIRGETGIEQFHSAHLEGDMIAGLTSVAGPRWGVMVPQPVSEIYTKVRANNWAIFMAIALALAITVCFVMLFINSLAAPLERFLKTIRANTRDQEINESPVRPGLIPVREVTEFGDSFNAMAREISAANAKIHTMAYMDSVTGLPNRVRLREMAEEIVDGHAPEEPGGILAFVDLDNFKQINDVHGHATGDLFLQDCAGKMQRVVGVACSAISKSGVVAREPVIARVGGDEFAILLPGLEESHHIRSFLRALQSEMMKQGEGLPFLNGRGASIGCARYPVNAGSLIDLLKLADIAMYHAKKSGKNRFQIYTPEIGTMTVSETRVAVEAAIAAGELTLEYQPKVDTVTGRAKGVEALVRWDHPKLGRLSPATWIPTIANTPVIRKLGEWVIERAMDDMGAWKRIGLDLDVAVNVGSEHFCYPGFASWLIQKSIEKGVDPSKIEVEVTEDTLFLSEESADEILGQLHQVGFRISIDDFGTGYSNIARLSQLPVDCIKIDRSIISKAHKDSRVGSMAECIVMMADRLGCETVAEGVENEVEQEFARMTGITTLQGYLFSASMSSNRLVDWVQAFDPSATANRPAPAKDGGTAAA